MMFVRATSVSHGAYSNKSSNFFYQCRLRCILERTEEDLAMVYFKMARTWDLPGRLKEIT